MIDDRHGIDLLRATIEDVAASLGPPAARPRRRWLLPSAVGVTILLIACAIGWRITRGPDSCEATLLPSSQRRLGIEVKHLRLHGRDVDVRVFDAAGAGTIVVAPGERAPRGG